MRRKDGYYECVQCGARLDIAEDAVPRVAIHMASGKKSERVITVDGREIHRCSISRQAGGKPA
jgi:hypothetical protein